MKTLIALIALSFLTTSLLAENEIEFPSPVTFQAAGDPNSSVCWFGTEDGSIHQVDLEKGEIERSIPCVEAPISKIVIDRQREQFALQVDKRIFIGTIDDEGWTQTAEFSELADNDYLSIYDMKFSSSGEGIYLVFYCNMEIFVQAWNIASNELSDVYNPHEWWNGFPVFSKKSDTIWIPQWNIIEGPGIEGSIPGDVVEIELTDGSVNRRIAGAWSAVWLADNENSLVLMSMENALNIKQTRAYSIYDFEEDKLQPLLRGAYTGIILSPSTPTVCLTHHGVDARLLLYDYKSNIFDWDSIEVPEATEAAYSPDGKYISNIQDGTILHITPLNEYGWFPRNDVETSSTEEADPQAVQPEE
jgi:hypothetical protein